MLEFESPSSDASRRGVGGCGGRGLRAFIEPRYLSPVALNDGGDGGLTTGRRSSYLKLPSQRLIKLSVVKLDGSVFDVQIAKDGTVAELRRAVEEVFTTSPKDGQGRISWSHVWGHFCLCYEGQKLVNDKACIRDFGIKDCDQLRFIRHLSIDHSPLNRRSTSKSCKRYLRSQMKSNTAEDKEQIAPCDNNINRICDDDELKSSSAEAQDGLPTPKFKLADYLRGWLLYTRLWGASRKGTETRSYRPSRFSLKLLK